MEKKSYGKSVYATLNNNECQILILIFVFYFWVIIHVSYFLVVFLLYCILSAGMPVIPVFRKGSRVYGHPLVEEFTELFGKSLNCLVSRTEPVHVNTMKVMMSVEMGLQ